MTDKTKVVDLSRRERQIMDLIYAAGDSTAAHVMGKLPDAPSYSAVRTLLRILEEKGHLSHRTERGKFVYIPIRPRQTAGRSALTGVLRTFFDNSAVNALAALMDTADTQLTDAELAELSKLIAKAKRKGRKP